MSDFVLAIDQGTTGTKLHRLHVDGRFETLAGFEHRQLFPNRGWVEHDPEELLGHLQACISMSPGAAALGIANQGETVVAWDAESKRAIYNAIVWQDARTHDTIESMKLAGHEALTMACAGLPLDPYFSASKFRWLLDNADGARQLHRAGRLRLGTSDSFFLDRLAGVFATDVSTASRTSLMNLQTLDWDPELCDLFGVPIECLPSIRSTTGDFGTVAGVKIAASIVDQQAALFGHGCRRSGDAKITFGTGAFALCITGDHAVRDAIGGLLPTLAWRLQDSSPTFALEGGVYNAASAVNWARGLGLFADYGQIDAFSSSSAIERGLVFVPALSGLGCPHWDRSAAGMWLGLGLETQREDLVQAVLEGVAFRAEEIIAAMAERVPIGQRISIDGGMASNNYFANFAANLLAREIAVPGTTELTGLGVAQLALIGADLSTLQGLPANTIAATELFLPNAPVPAHLKEKFRDAVNRCRGWR